MATKKYNVIGDVHGSEKWKNLVVDDAVNIFVGDYFDHKGEPAEDAKDPTDPTTVCYGSRAEHVISNFLEIIRYKQQHPETILLLGNHDLHYLIDEKYSSYDEQHAPTNYLLLQTFRPLFYGFVYSIENEVLVSHAGVTEDWLKMVLGKNVETADMMPDEVARKVNGLLGMDSPDKPFDSKLLYRYLSADRTFAPGDYCGESAAASPVWVRPGSLIDCNIFRTRPQLMQVVGHTPVEKVELEQNVLFIDCLQTTSQSLLVEKRADGVHYERRGPSPAG